jgi:ribosomal protein S18 acetylase RimI-like enzyme
MRDLERHEAKLIGDIIADSFASDPVNQWVFNGQAAMKPTFTRFAHYIYLPRGYGHVLESGEAGTLWLPPGASTDTGAFGSLMVAAGVLRHGGPTAARNGLALEGFLKKKKPREPHHYLFAIAARPGAQGKGLGSQLMKEGLKRADADHMPAYLESSKPENVPFYEKYGFEVVEQVTPAPGCPPMWLMWREARA